MRLMNEGPLCVFCGAARPAEVEICPECGRPWIDERINTVAATVAAPGVAASVPVKKRPGTGVRGMSERSANLAGVAARP